MQGAKGLRVAASGAAAYARLGRMYPPDSNGVLL